MRTRRWTQKTYSRKKISSQPQRHGTPLPCVAPRKAQTLATLKTHEYRVKLHHFMEKLELAGFAYRSIGNYAYDLSLFFAWLETSENVTTFAGLAPVHITAWHTHLHYGTFKNGCHLSTGTISQRLGAVKLFFRTFRDECLTKEDLARHVILPKLKKSLPRNIPSKSDLSLLLDAIKPNDPISLRDRCIMELLYAAGLRATEILTLPIESLDLSAKTIFITGKGSKDRIVPIGSWVCPWLVEYLTVGRKRLVDDRRPNGFLFLSKNGNPMYEATLCLIIKRWIEKAGLTLKIPPHSFRHACATHLLEGGADIRYIQELLGHSELSTTQVYTKVDITALKKAHNMYHPRQRENE